MLFDQKERTRVEPKQPGENDFQFYDTAAGVDYGTYREFVNGWIAELPEAARPDPIARLTLSDFRESRFQDVNLGDCTALFLFFENCRFDRCYINAESIGFSYGLSSENLNSLQLIYLGRKQRNPC
jgi:hypothetical protein